MTFDYACSECGAVHAMGPSLMVCPACEKDKKEGEPLRGILEVRLKAEDGEDFQGGNFSPLDLLPVEREFFPPIPVGNTPLWKPRRLRERFDRPELFIKDDTANPTGSLKDRASWLVAAFARKYHHKEIVLASTGNAGSSMSGIGAAAGLKVRLYLPKSAPPAKLVQALQYGAELIRVDETYDEAFARSMKWHRETGSLSRNTAHNPMTIEGKKTAALEIFLQLGKRMPDHVFVPVGDGVIISGVYKGFRDLVVLGLADRVPTIHGVQAEGSSALARAVAKRKFTPPMPSKTLADSISVDVPAGGYYALKQILNYGGRVFTVSDREILAAQGDLSSWTGLFVEPAAAASYAGFLKVEETISPKESVVLLATGSGLKDIESAAEGGNLR